MPFLQYMMTQFDFYNQQDVSQRDYVAKEWQLYTLEILASNMLSKDNIKTTVVCTVSIPPQCDCISL